MLLFVAADDDIATSAPGRCVHDRLTNVMEFMQMLRSIIMCLHCWCLISWRTARS